MYTGKPYVGFLLLCFYTKISESVFSSTVGQHFFKILWHHFSVLKRNSNLAHKKQNNPTPTSELYFPLVRRSTLGLASFSLSDNLSSAAEQICPLKTLTLLIKIGMSVDPSTSILRKAKCFSADLWQG